MTLDKRASSVETKSASSPATVRQHLYRPKLEHCPTFFLHGFSHTSAQWHAVHVLAEAANYRPLRLPFHEAGAEANFAAASDALWQQVDRAVGRDTKVLLAGYSLGGRLALGMAKQRGERLAGLLLVSTHFGAQTDEQRASRAAADEAWARRFVEQPLAEALAAFRQQPVFQKATPWPGGLDPGCEAARLAVAAQAARYRLTSSELAAHFAAIGLAAMPNCLPTFAALTVPTALVAGANDQKFVALAAAAKAMRPDSLLVAVESAAHDVLWDAPLRVAAALRSLQRRVRTRDDGG